MKRLLIGLFLLGSFSINTLAMEIIYDGEVFGNSGTCIYNHSDEAKNGGIFVFKLNNGKEIVTFSSVNLCYLEAEEGNRPTRPIVTIVNFPDRPYSMISKMKFKNWDGESVVLEDHQFPLVDTEYLKLMHFDDIR